MSVRRWRLAAGALALVLLLVLLAALWWWSRPAAEPAPAPPQASAPATGAPLPPAHPQPEPPSAPSGRAPAPQVAGPAAPAGPAVLDLCGVGRLPAPPLVPGSESHAHDLPTPLGRDADDALRPQLKATLQAQGARGQAAALLLAPDLLADAALRRRSATTLAALGRESGDGLLIHLALALCRWGGPADACGVSARDWVRAEPANAAAWLALAHDEPGARAEALAGLQQARRHRLHYGALTALMLQHWPPGQPEYLQLVQSFQMVNMESVLSVGALAGALALRDLCPGDLAPGSAGREVCDGVVRQLTERADTLAARGQGIALARRLGWPPEVVRAMQADHDTLTAAVLPPLTGDEQPYGCPALAARRRHLAEVARLGEVGAARAAHQRERASAAGR